VSISEGLFLWFHLGRKSSVRNSTILVATVRLSFFNQLNSVNGTRNDLRFRDVQYVVCGVDAVYAKNWIAGLRRCGNAVRVGKDAKQLGSKFDEKEKGGRSSIES